MPYDLLNDGRDRGEINDPSWQTFSKKHFSKFLKKLNHAFLRLGFTNCYQNNRFDKINITIF